MPVWRSKLRPLYSSWFQRSRLLYPREFECTSSVAIALRLLPIAENCSCIFTVGSPICDPLETLPLVFSLNTMQGQSPMIIVEETGSISCDPDTQDD
jgi:hypothetical protein